MVIFSISKIYLKVQRLSPPSRMVSSVLMVFYHSFIEVRKHVVPLVPVDGPLGTFDPYCFANMSSSLVTLSIYDLSLFPVYFMILLCGVICKCRLVDGALRCFSLISSELGICVAADICFVFI